MFSGLARAHRPVGGSQYVIGRAKLVVTTSGRYLRTLGTQTRSGAIHGYDGLSLEKYANEVSVSSALCLKRGCDTY